MPPIKSDWEESHLLLNCYQLMVDRWSCVSAASTEAVRIQSLAAVFCLE
jgi:hypothetical protein